MNLSVSVTSSSRPGTITLPAGSQFTSTVEDVSYIFQTIEDFHCHLQVVCKSVQVICDECEKVFSREDFRNPSHDCFIKKTQKKLVGIDQNMHNKIHENLKKKLDAKALSKLQIQCP